MGSWRCVLVTIFLAYYDEVRPHDDTTANTSKALVASIIWTC